MLFAAAHPRRYRSVALAVLLALAIGSGLPTASQVQVQERVDLDAVQRIRHEAFERSQVMEVASYLTDIHGPRLTGSPNLRAAAQYAKETLSSWGISNARFETWGEFGRGWTNDRFVALARTPQAYSLIGHPKAWTPGTDGPIVAEAVLAVITSDADIMRFKGRLRGKFVLTAPPRELEAQFQPLARRFTDAELSRLAGEARPRQVARRPETREQQGFAARRMRFFIEEGVAALLEPGRGDGGTIFVLSGGSRAPNAPPVPPQVVLAAEHYGRIARTLERGVPVSLEIDIQNTFHDDDLSAFNVLAELAGSDQADEVVMLGAHLDSWHTGTGATDNAAGSAVVMEAIRILKATGLPLRRTVRVALWTGEEQGFLGSRGYVALHVADRQSMSVKSLHGRLSAYFNHDNGAGAVRGVYLQGNEAVRPIFDAWMEPFRADGMTTLSIRGTNGTDHVAFDEVGIPGFQFIQDPLEYSSRTHHSNMDVYERLQPKDLMHNAAVLAAFVYHAANREEMLPRKALPAASTTARPAPSPR